MTTLTYKIKGIEGNCIIYDQPEKQNYQKEKELLKQRERKINQFYKLLKTKHAIL